MLSLYFSYFILYSLILLIVSLLNSYITNFITILNFLLIVPLLLIIGIFYFIGEKITVQSKKNSTIFESVFYVHNNNTLLLFKNIYLKFEVCIMRLKFREYIAFSLILLILGISFLYSYPYYFQELIFRELTR